MKHITKEMIKIYNIKDFDFMGYTIDKEKSLTYHHMIVPKRLGGHETIENGALLMRDTSHDYLHLIEIFDKEIFDLITDEMIKENIRRKLLIDSLKRIRKLLEYFEREHCNDTNRNGRILIKQEYYECRINNFDNLK